MQFLLATTVLLAFMQFTHGDDYCFGKDKDKLQTRQFSSKTVYETVKGKNMEKQYIVPNCVPVKIWIYHRHGTRLPSKKFISDVGRLDELRDAIVKNYDVSRTKPDTNALCKEDKIALQTWRWNSSILVENANFLTQQGYEDLRGTAKLYQRYFPRVLTRTYSPESYLLRHTDTQRTEESFKAFAEGLFGTNAGVEPVPIPQKDVLLQPYDYCPPWTMHNHGNEPENEPEPDPAIEPEPIIESEVAKFKKSTVWKRMVQDTSRRLGFLYNLTESDIELMYDMCRYEHAWHSDRISAWCAAFLPEHITIREYSNDLEYYDKVGYGYSGNEKLACHSIKDMLDHLNNNENPKVVAYFGHTTGLQTFLTGLGINKDDLPLRADNIDQQADRRFKSSKNDPFAANFLAVKYQCPSDAINPEKAVFFLNQNAVNLDWCSVGLCNWSEVLKRYASFKDADCDSVYCNSSMKTAGSTLVLLFAVIFYLLN